MPLDGGKLICLNDDGSKGTEVLATGSIFRIGYLMNNDYILQDSKALPTHCEICCDAWDRITIHNKSEEYPVKLDDQVVHIKSRLLSGSKITILQAMFLWEFEKSDMRELQQNLTEQNVGATPIRQEDEKPAAYSCPDLRFHREKAKRLTVHNFAYCIHHNEEGNISSELENTANDMRSIAEEVESEKEEEERTENERCTTPADLAQQNNSLNATPITQILNATANKSTGSTDKQSNVITSCKFSDVLITSFTPRETGVRIDKSFTALIKPKMTPKSLYSTPKSLLYDTMTDCEQSRNLTGTNFATPATSKKQLTHNTSMHMVDLTTPKKLAPASPMPKSALKKRTDKITPRNLSLKEHTMTPSNAVGVCRINSSSSGSGLSVEIVDSSAEVIEISADDNSASKLNTPQKTALPPLSKIMTPKRTPQTLRQRVLLNSAKKSCMTVDRNRQVSAVSQNKLLTKRLSLCTPPRKPVTMNSTSIPLTTSTPKSNLASDTQFMPSTSKSSSSLYGIRKSVGNTTFAGRITKNRTSLPMNRSLVCVRSQQILAKACKTLISPPSKGRLTTAVTMKLPLAKSAQKVLKNTHAADSIYQQTQTEASEDVKQNFEEQRSLNVTFSPVKENPEMVEEQSLNGTFSVDMEVREQADNVKEERQEETIDYNSDEADKKQINDIYVQFDAVTKFLENEKNMVIEPSGENSSGRETDELLKEITDVLNKSDELQRKRTFQTLNKENNKNDVNEKIINGQVEYLEKDNKDVVPSMPLILIETENNKNKLKTPMKSPNLCGVRELMQLPKNLGQATPIFTGMKNLLRTPKSHAMNDDNEHFEGLKDMLQTPLPPRRASITADMEIRTCSPKLKRRTLLRRKSVGGFETDLWQTEFKKKMFMDTAEKAQTIFESENEKEISEITSTEEDYIEGAELADYAQTDIPIVNTENDQEMKSAILLEERENNEEEEEEDFIPETQAIDCAEKDNFDCFLKSPRAKNLMVSTRQSDILDKTDDDMNSSEALEFGDIFNPLDEPDEAEKTNKSSTNKTIDVLDTEPRGEEKNLSSEEKFDKLLVNDESSSSSFLARTPMVSKVYAHASSSKQAAFSSFTSSDVISDLPKTDIEVWVNSLETQKPDDNIDADDDCVEILENQNLKSSTPTIEEEQDDRKSDISGIMPLDKSEESSVQMEQLRLSDDSDVEEAYDEDEEIPETQMPCKATSRAAPVEQNTLLTENETEIVENVTILNESQNEVENSGTSTIFNMETEEILAQEKPDADDLEKKDDNEEESNCLDETQIVEKEKTIEKTELYALVVEDDDEEENNLAEHETDETQIDENELNESINEENNLNKSQISNIEKEEKLDNEQEKNIFTDETQIVENETIEKEEILEKTESDALVVKEDNEEENNLVEHETGETQIDENELNESSVNEGNNLDKLEISNIEKEDKLEKTESYALVVEDDNEDDNNLETVETDETQIKLNESKIEGTNADALEIEAASDQNSTVERVEEAKSPANIRKRNPEIENYADGNSLDEISNIIELVEDVAIANTTEHYSIEQSKLKDVEDVVEIEKNAENATEELDEIVVNEDKEIFNQQNEHDTPKPAEAIQKEFEEKVVQSMEENLAMKVLENTVDDINEYAAETFDNKKTDKSFGEDENKTNQNEMTAEVINVIGQNEKSIKLETNLDFENETVASDKENTQAVSEIGGVHDKEEEKEQIEENLQYPRKEEVLEIIEKTTESADKAGEKTFEESSAINSILESEDIFEAEYSVEENTKVENESIPLDNNESADAEITSKKPIESVEIIVKSDTEMEYYKKTESENESQSFTSRITNDETDTERQVNSNKNVPLSSEIVENEILVEHADLKLKENNLKNLNNSIETNQIKNKKVQFGEEFENLNISDKSITGTTKQPIIKSNLQAHEMVGDKNEATFTMQLSAPKLNSDDDFQTPSGSENSSITSDVPKIEDGMGEIAPTFSKRKKYLSNTEHKHEDVQKIAALEEKEIEVAVQVEQKNKKGAGRKRKGSESESETISQISKSSTRSTRIAKKEQVEVEPIEKRSRRGKNADKLNAIVEVIAPESTDEQIEEPAKTTVNVKLGRRGRKPSVSESPLPNKILQQALRKATLTASTPSNKEKLLITDDMPIQQATEISVDISAVTSVVEKANEETMPDTSRPRTRGRGRANKEQSEVNVGTPATRTRRARKVTEETEITLPTIVTTLVDGSAMTSKVAHDEADSQLAVVQTSTRTRRAQKANVTTGIVDTTSTRAARHVRERQTETVERELKKNESDETKKKSTAKKDKVDEKKEPEETKKPLPRKRQVKTAKTKTALHDIEQEEKVEETVDDMPVPVENKVEPVRKRGRKASEKCVEEAEMKKVIEINEKFSSTLETARKRGRKVSEKSVNEPTNTKTKGIEENEKLSSTSETVKKRGRKASEKSVDEPPVTKTKGIEENEKLSSTSETVKKRGRKASEKSVDEPPVTKAKIVEAIDETVKIRSRRGGKTTKKEEKTIDIIEEEHEEEEEEKANGKNKGTFTEHIHASTDSDANDTPTVAEQLTTTKSSKAKRAYTKKQTVVEKNIPQAVEEPVVTDKKVGRATRGRKNAVETVTDSAEELMAAPKKRATRARK